MSTWQHDNATNVDIYSYPTPYMVGGHAQTIYAALNKFTKVNQIRYVRRILESPDGGTISMDFTSSDDPNKWIDTDSSRPLLVILHGLTGGSHESYVRALLAELTKRPHWRAVVVNFRGCAETPVTSQRLYSAGWTEDIRLATRWLRHRYPNAPFVGAGFSLGANIFTKACQNKLKVNHYLFLSTLERKDLKLNTELPWLPEIHGISSCLIWSWNLPTLENMSIHPRWAQIWVESLRLILNH